MEDNTVEDAEEFRHSYGTVTITGDLQIGDNPCMAEFDDRLETAEGRLDDLEESDRLTLATLEYGQKAGWHGWWRGFWTGVAVTALPAFMGLIFGMTHWPWG